MTYQAEDVQTTRFPVSNNRPYCGSFPRENELFSVAPDGLSTEIRRQNGVLAANIPMQHSVYNPAQVVALLNGASGVQLVVQEWSEDETSTECVMHRNRKAGPLAPVPTHLELARMTCY